jgi:hypothetical protein
MVGQTVRKILRLLRLPKVARMSPPLIPILSQINPAYKPLRSSSVLIHATSRSPKLSPHKQFYALLIRPKCATFPVYLIVLDFIVLIITGEENKLLIFSLCYLQKRELASAPSVLHPLT